MSTEDEYKDYTVKPIPCDLKHDLDVVVGYIRADLIGLWGRCLEKGADKLTLKQLQNSIDALKDLKELAQEKDKRIKELIARK